MIGPSGEVCVMVATRPVDFRKGAEGLAASFVLAWWNAEVHGGFDLADLFAVDRAIARDMAVVFDFIAGCADGAYPGDYRAEIERIIQIWRPEAWAQSRGDDAA